MNIIIATESVDLNLKNIKMKIKYNQRKISLEQQKALKETQNNEKTKIYPIQKDIGFVVLSREDAVKKGKTTTGKLKKIRRSTKLRRNTKIHSETYKFRK